MTITLSGDDEGRTVVDAHGTTLGLVTDVEGDEASVDPDPSVTETLSAELGFADGDEDEYTVHQDAIEARDGEELRLRGDL